MVQIKVFAHFPYGQTFIDILQYSTRNIHTLFCITYRTRSSSHKFFRKQIKQNLGINSRNACHLLQIIQGKTNKNVIEVNASERKQVPYKIVTTKTNTH